MFNEWESSALFGRKKRHFTVTAYLLTKDELLRWLSSYTKTQPYGAENLREATERDPDSTYYARFSGDIPDTVKEKVEEGWMYRDGHDYLMQPIYITGFMNNLLELGLISPVDTDVWLPL